MNTKSIGRNIRQQNVILPGLLMAFLLLGCGSFRKVERQQAESLVEQAVEISKDSLQTEDQRSIRVLLQGKTDSSASGYIMEIWPKGKFSISNTGGFEGEAEKVKLRGKLVSTNRFFQLDEQAEVRHALKQVNTQNIRQEKKAQKQELVKKNPAWKWALVLLSVLIFLNLYGGKSLPGIWNK
jgi:hypothetical protein